MFVQLFTSLCVSTVFLPQRVYAERFNLCVLKSFLADWLLVLVKSESTFVSRSLLLASALGWPPRHHLDVGECDDCSATGAAGCKCDVM